MEIEKEQLLAKMREYFEPRVESYKSHVATLQGKPEHEIEKRFVDGYVNCGWHFEKFVNDLFEGML